jgi:hypothetical protein
VHIEAPNDGGAVFHMQCAECHCVNKVRSGADTGANYSLLTCFGCFVLQVDQHAQCAVLAGEKHLSVVSMNLAVVVALLNGLNFAKYSSYQKAQDQGHEHGRSRVQVSDEHELRAHQPDCY